LPKLQSQFGGVSELQSTSLHVLNPAGSFGQSPDEVLVVTDTFAVPLWPSAVAVMLALPVATAVTRPVVETVATEVFVLAQVIVRPVSTLPLASLRTADACVVWPTLRLLVPSDTLTVATGASVTVILACPETPPLVATTFALPAPTAVATPELLTVATAVFELVHVIVRPVSTFPLASFNTAVACVVCPVVKLLEPNDTVTDATGTAVTVRLDWPVIPSLVATMLALPTLTAVTSPELLTVATAVFELVHVIVRPVSTFPLASFNTAVACVVCPAVTLVVPNDTVTDATGATVTVTIACPVTPSLVATIFAVPAPTAVTSPELLTLATAVFELVHVIVRPVNTLPLASVSSGVASVVCPTTRLLEPNETVTVATGASITVTLAWPLTPSLVATMFALPAPIAVTYPEDETVATAEFELVQVTVRPVRTLPPASFKTGVA
jgi:hypothetical protein